MQIPSVWWLHYKSYTDCKTKAQTILNNLTKHFINETEGKKKLKPTLSHGLTEVGGSTDGKTEERLIFMKN